MNFDELGLNSNILKILDTVGYEKPTLIQEKTIPLVFKGLDVVGRSETGSGKTMAFALPIIQKIDPSVQNIQSIIICPTRELAMQCSNEITKITSQLENIRVVTVFGGSDMRRQINNLKRKPQIIVATPGRLIDHMKRKTIKLNNVKIVVFDEADEMLDMGFRPDLEQILKSVPQERQVLLFSATIPTEIKNIIKNYLHNEVLIEIGEENRALNSIEQFYATCKQDEKKELLLELVKQFGTEKTIIFANTKRMVDVLYEFLKDNEIVCAGLHGDKRQSERTRVMKGMKSGENPVLIATDVASRGIDIKDVKYVINYDLPTKQELYVHRIGRTARAGESGKVVNIIANGSQLKALNEIGKITQAEFKEMDTKFKAEFKTRNSARKSESGYGRSNRSGNGYGRSNRSENGYGRSNRSENGYGRSNRSESGFKTRRINREESFGERSDERKSFSKNSYRKNDNYNNRNEKFVKSNRGREDRFNSYEQNDENQTERRDFSYGRKPYSLNRRSGFNRNSNKFERNSFDKNGHKKFERNSHENFGRDSYKKFDDEFSTDEKPFERKRNVSFDRKRNSFDGKSRKDFSGKERSSFNRKKRNDFEERDHKFKKFDDNESRYSKKSSSRQKTEESGKKSYKRSNKTGDNFSLENKKFRHNAPKSHKVKYEKKRS